MRSWGFYFSATPDDLVVNGEIRFDAPAPYVGAVSRLYVANLDRDGQYIRPMILAYAADTVVYIESAGDTFAHVRLIGAPRQRIRYLELPIVVLTATPTGLAGGPVIATFMLTTATAGAPPPAPRDAATDPLLVTMATAKDHLGITDTLHDADVSQKLHAASATIRDYLKARNDPTWTDITAPPWVVQAVLFLLAHLYENRGDNFGASNDNDDRVWSAIGKMLVGSRDPTLA